MNVNKTRFLSFTRVGAITTFSGRSLKLEEQFRYLASNQSKGGKSSWTFIDQRIRDLSDKIKQEFFQAVTVEILQKTFTN